MANPRYREGIPSDRKDRGMPPKQKPGHKPTSMPERSAAWPGLAGKTEPKPSDRAKTPRTKCAAKEEGLY